MKDFPLFKCPFTDKILHRREMNKLGVCVSVCVCTRAHVRLRKTQQWAQNIPMFLILVGIKDSGRRIHWAQTL